MIVPQYIRDLCVEVQNKVGSPSEAREVIADWCEANGSPYYAQLLRPRPAGRNEAEWLRERAAIIRYLAGNNVPSMLAPVHRWTHDNIEGPSYSDIQLVKSDQYVKRCSEADHG